MLEKMNSKTAKVFAVSKISVPSLAHPHVPYFALLLEDEFKNKWAQKSFKEYSVGQSVDYPASADAKTVAIWRIKYDLSEAIEKIIGLIGEPNIKPKSKILIIPALNEPRHPYFKNNTSPDFLEQTILLLINRGAQKENIQIAGQSFNDIPIEACAMKSGLLNVCLKYGIPPLDLSKIPFAKKDDLEISENVFSADIILNLAMLKTGKACASENLFKFLNKKNYLGLKYLYGEKEIFKKIQTVLPEILTLAEADRIQTEEKFVSFLGLAMASRDSLGLDAVFNKIRPGKALPKILADIKMEDVLIAGRQLEESKFDNINI